MAGTRVWSRPECSPLAPSNRPRAARWGRKAPTSWMRRPSLRPSGQLTAVISPDRACARRDGANPSRSAETPSSDQLPRRSRCSLLSSISMRNRRATGSQCQLPRWVRDAPWVIASGPASSKRAHKGHGPGAPRQSRDSLARSPPHEIRTTPGRAWNGHSPAKWPPPAVRAAGD